MKKFEKLSEKKFNTIENKSMAGIFGGNMLEYTLNTFTVSPEGGKDDGDDGITGD